MPDIWPSLKAYISLFRAFQGGVGGVRSTKALSAPVSGQFRFAVAYSDSQDLASATVRCVQEVKRLKAVC